MLKVRDGKVHVCFLISSLVNEGPTRILLNIVRRINRDRFRVSVITLVPERKNSLFDDFSKLSVPVFFQSELNSNIDKTSFLGRVKAIKAHLAANDVDIVHAHCPRSLIYLMFLGSFAKTVYTAHIFPGVQTLALYGNFKGRLVSALCNLLIRFVDRPVACSDSVSQEYKENIGLDIMAVNNGIERKLSMLDAEARTRSRASLGLSVDLKYFLFVGRLSPEKSPAELVELFSKTSIPDIQLILIGEGPEEHKIRALSSDRIRLDGFQTNVLPYLEACDYYISPSKTEGLANSLLEAMSAGLPMLLSDIPSHRLVVERAGAYIGELFDPTSSLDFESKMRRLLGHDRSKLSPEIIKEFERRYTADAMASGYQAVYEELVN